MEPIYEYVRGQGWVAKSILTVEATMKCGTRIRLEDRRPEEGEHYLRATGWFTDAGKPLMNEFKYCIENEYRDWNQFVLHRTFGNGSTKGTITVVRL